jgi:hypothetical protein
VKLFLALSFVASAVSFATAAEKSINDAVQDVFAELRTLKPMERGRIYTLTARCESLTGRRDDFLRRRTAGEITGSKLSSGCGDYAAVFAAGIGRLGLQTMLVDAAEVSLHALVNRFDGHVVVAIRPGAAPNSPWWLVDPTARDVISRDWSPQSTSFSTSSGGVYRIGYCGPMEGYTVSSPDELKRFYADTLAAVPKDFFNRTLYRFTFEVDASLLDDLGRPLNPQLGNLARQQDEILAKLGIWPAREIRILLTRGGDDASSDLKYSPDRGWVSRLGLQSACSSSFLSYLEQTVRRRVTRVVE